MPLQGGLARDYEDLLNQRLQDLTSHSPTTWLDASHAGNSSDLEPLDCQGTPPESIFTQQHTHDMHGTHTNLYCQGLKVVRSGIK